MSLKVLTVMKCRRVELCSGLEALTVASLGVPWCYLCSEAHVITQVVRLYRSVAWVLPSATVSLSSP